MINWKGCGRSHGLIKVPAHSFLEGLRKAITGSGISDDTL